MNPNLYDVRLKPEEVEKAIRNVDEQLRRIRHSFSTPKIEQEPAAPEQRVPQWFLDHLALVERALKRDHVPEDEWKYWNF